MYFSPVYGTLNEKRLRIEGTTKPWGDTDIPFNVTVYLILAKIQCGFSKLPNKGIPVYFPRVYGTFNENQLLRAQQNEEGDTDIRLLSRYTSCWQKKRGRYLFWMSFSRCACILVAAENPRSNTYMTTNVRIIARNSQQTTQSTRDTTQPCLLYTSPSPRD